MSENRFERFISSRKQEQERARLARVALEAERLEQERQKSIKQAREIRGPVRDAPRAAGTHPSRLWGEEAGKLCSDFLQFVGARATRANPYPKATQLVHPDRYIEEEYEVKRLFRDNETRTKKHLVERGYAMQGYGVAYNRPRRGLQRVENQEFAAVADDSYTLERKAREAVESVTPIRDVFLCTDGLVRRGPVPSSNIYSPEFGDWTVRSQFQPWQGWLGDGFNYIGHGETEVVRKKRTVTYEMLFKPTDPVIGLEKVLGAYAIEIEKEISG